MPSAVPIAWPGRPEPKQRLGDRAQPMALGGWIKDPTSQEETRL